MGFFIWPHRNVSNGNVLMKVSAKMRAVRDYVRDPAYYLPGDAHCTHHRIERPGVFSQKRENDYVGRIRGNSLGERVMA